MAARALWSSLLLGPLFLVSGLSTGAAFAMLFHVSRGEHEIFRRWDIVAILVEILLLGLFFADLTSGGQASRAAAGLFFGGPYTAVFWSLVFLAGLVVPLTFEILEGTRRRTATALAPVSLRFGGFLLRWILVFAGQAT